MRLGPCEFYKDQCNQAKGPRSIGVKESIEAEGGQEVQEHKKRVKLLHQARDVGAEHVAAIGRRFGQTDPKKVEQLLAGPPLSDSLLAVAAPSLAVGAPLALGQRFLPPLPKRGMWLAWAVLPAGYEMYIVRQRYDTYRGVAAVQEAVEGTV